METQSEPLQQWLAARRQLDHAIEHFLESLNALYASRPTYSRDLGLLEKATSEAHQDLGYMTTRINKIQSAQVTLRKIRNDSISLVPMNRLPLEVLLKILHLSTRRTDPFDAFLAGITHHHYPKESIALTQVCTYWRELVLNTPTLWSDFYFDVGVFKNINRSKSHNPFSDYLEHARDRLSSITISAHNTMSYISKHRLAIRSCLGRYINSIGILRFIDVPIQVDLSVLWFLFELWQEEGRPGSVHSLAIFTEDKDTALSRRRNWNMASSTYTFKDWGSFLLPIRVLRLAGPYFRWDSPVFHNLVVLQVGYLHKSTSPTSEQMWAVLSASPQLESLQLFSMTITPGDSTPLRPVVLGSLQMLDIRTLDFPGIQHLLPMINPQSQELSMSAPMTDPAHEPGPEIISFLARSNITTFFLDAGPSPIDTLPLSAYLSATPNVHTLILDLGSRSGDMLLSEMTQSNPPAMPTARYPEIHTLNLINGSFEEATIYKIVKAHPRLRKLGFLPCFLEPSDEEVLYWLRSLVNDVTHTRNSLSEDTLLNWLVTLV